MKTVSAHVWDPRNSIFKTKKTDRPEFTTVTCSLDSCPLRDEGKCSTVPLLFPGYCPYGKYNKELGPLPRAKAFQTWLTEKNAIAQTLPNLKSANKKMAFVGDWVYLPYAHMDMMKAIPFLRHSEFFISGIPFLKKEFWTIENVLNLIDFKPTAMMGGEITTYQSQEVPKFISHLSELDKPMFEQLLALRPKYDVAPNYVGRKALLTTLNFPLTWTVKNEKYNYPVTWYWDGRDLHTESLNVFNSTWGEVKMKSVKISGVPEDGTFVVVKDNAWVNENTKFID